MRREVCISTGRRRWALQPPGLGLPHTADGRRAPQATRSMPAMIHQAHVSGDNEYRYSVRL